MINAAEKAADVTISGTTTGVEDGQSVSVEINGEIYLAEVNGNAWSVSVPSSDMAGWAEGIQTITANVSDKAGNAAEQAVTTVMLDTTAPMITINTPIAGDDVINAVEACSPLVISGTTDAEVGQRVTVYLGGKQYESDPLTADGNWSVTIPADDLSILPQIDVTFAATVYDVAGNMGQAAQVVTVDTVAPTVTLEIEKSVLNSNDPSSEITLTFSEIPHDAAGIPLTAAQIQAMLTLPSSVTLDVLTTDDGGLTWTGTLTATNDTESTTGSVSVSDAYYDKAGNQGADATKEITVDTQAPEITLNEIGDGNLSFTEASELVLSGSTTGVAEGRDVTLTIRDKDGTVKVVTATVQSDGTYSTTVDISAGLAEGPITVVAEVTDEAGNSANADKEATLDLTAPSITIEAVAGDDVVDWSEKMVDGFTVTGTVTGAEAGRVITVTFDDADGNPILDADGNPISLTTTVGTTDSWTVDVSTDLAKLLKDGVAKADVSDAAGNSAEATQPYELAAPAAPVITGYYDNIAYVLNIISSQGELNDSTSVSGTITNQFGGSLAFDTVASDVLTGEYGTFTFDTATGSWTYTFHAGQAQTLGDSNGPLNDALTVTDTEGNEHQIQVSIHDMFPAGKATVTATTVALKDEVWVKDSQVEGWLTGTEGGSSVVSDISVDGSQMVGGSYEVLDKGKLTIFEDGRYIFEPYDDGVTLQVSYTLNGATQVMDITATEPVSYSNDVLGKITGTVEGVENGEVILRLYANKESIDDSAPVDYGPISYPNGHDVTVTVTDGQWSISPEQLREVLLNIWWADQLRGDDEIYLQVKLVDPVTGKASETSNKYTFVADTYAPEATHVDYVAGEGTYGHVTALVSGDLITAKRTHADTGDEVTITYNGAIVGTGVVGDVAPGFGHYLQIDVALTEALPSGYDPAFLKVHVTDKAGNTGTSNDARVQPLDADLPIPVVEAYIDNVEGGIEGGDVSSGGITNDRNGEIRGTIDLNIGSTVDEVWVYVRGLGPIRVEPAADGSWSVTPEQLSQLTTTGTLQDGLVTVVAYAYNAAANVTGAASDAFEFTVDGTPPTVAITIDEAARIIGESSQVSFKFSEEIAGDLTSSAITVVGGMITNIVQDTSDPTLWTAVLTPDSNYSGEASVTLADGSYSDRAGNKGSESNATVAVDTIAPTVTVSIDANELIIGDTTEITLTFTEVPYGSDGTPLTGAQLTALLLQGLSGTEAPQLSTLATTDGGLTWTATLTPPSDYEGNITLTIPAGSYFDVAGNTGLLGSDQVNVDTIPPVVANDADDVTESTPQQPGNKSQATGNVLTNDQSSDGVKVVTEFKVTVDGVEQSVTAGDSIITKYGTVTIQADGTYTYTLDNMRPATKQLNTGNSPVEEITYVVSDKSGNTVEAILAVTVNGTNDVPTVVLGEESITPIVTNGWFSSVPTAQNTAQNNSSETTMSFRVDGVDPSTVRAVINLERVDNTFSILVNDDDIYGNPTSLNTIFQVEAGDTTTGWGNHVVALRFADGQWLSSGQPWDMNLNGLPRFQIILTEHTVRFFATRTTTSTELEEIFIGTNAPVGSGFENIFPEGLTNPGIDLPDFVSGKNTVTVINPNGVGQDLIQGYMKVTAGGSFDIADIDDTEIASATITLLGTQPGDSLVAVLPLGITATETTVGGNKVLTLTGSASLSDYEDALNSVMFMGGSATGERTVEIKITDSSGAESSVLTGTYNHATPVSKQLLTGGPSTIDEWSDAGFKAVGFDNGTVESGGVLNTGTVAGTSHGTNISTYTDSGGWFPNGNGIGVGTSGALTSGNERMVIDLGFDAMRAKVSATNFTTNFIANEIINWRSYDKDGKLVGSGTINANKYPSGNNATVRDFHVVPNVDGHDQFRYIVLQAGSGGFRIDGLEATSSYDANAAVSLSEFTYPENTGNSTDSIGFSDFGEPMFMALEDDIDFDPYDHDSQVVHITEDETTNIAAYKNAEEIHLDGSVHLDLSYSDLLSSRELLTDSSKPLKIFGGEDDVLDFGNNGADTEAVSEDSYVDSSSDDMNELNIWVKNGSVTENGVVFDVYEYHNSVSSGGDIDTKNQVLVQQGIEII